MTAILATLTVGFAMVMITLTVIIVVVRAVGDARRTRDARLRPRFEEEIAEYLIDPDRSEPELSDSRERGLFLRVVLEILVEVRGVDHERLTALLERMGFVDDLVRQLTARRRAARRRAAVAFVSIASESARGPLIRALGDRDPEVRISSALALVAIGADEVLPQILEVAAGLLADHPYSAAELMLGAGRRSPSMLSQEFRVGSPGVRRSVAEILGLLRIVDAADDLREVLASADEELVAVAARSLGLIGDAEALPALSGLVGDEHRPEFVRVAAVRAIGAIGDPAAGPAAARALDSDLSHLRSAAAEALALLGWPAVTAVPGDRALPARGASAGLHP